MGHEGNHIGNSPVDVLHTIWGGLMKSMCTFVLAIFQQIQKYSKNEQYDHILQTLDERIAFFPRICLNIPHVQWTFFPNGLVSKLIDTLTNSDLKGNTGKGGGFRSAYFVTALIQIYFSLEGLLPKGDVKISKRVKVNLPEQSDPTNRYEVIKITLRSVEKIIKDAIEIILHLNFELSRDYWNENLIKVLEKIITDFQTKYIAIWKLKEYSFFRTPSKLPGWKLHDVVHFPTHIREFGPVWGWETGPFESFNKIVKRLWKKTSTRSNSECQELIKQDLIRILMAYVCNQEDFLSGRFAEKPIVEREVATEVTTFSFACNEENSRELAFDFGQNGSGFRVLGIDSDIYQRFIISADSFSSKFLEFINLEKLLPLQNFRFIHRKRVRINGSRNSMIGSILLHAYSNGRLQWYDFVLVLGGGGKQLLAQVICIIEIVDQINNSSQVCFFVKYLESSTLRNEKTISSNNRSDYLSLKEPMCVEYRWAAGTNYRYDIDVISQESVADIAFVVPSFKNNVSEHRSSDHSLDRFFHVHRKFFDRSGWVANTQHLDTSFVQTSSSKATNKISKGIKVDENFEEATENDVYSCQVRSNHDLQNDVDRLAMIEEQGEYKNRDDFNINSFFMEQNDDVS
jgi:hypothetical protein